MRFLVFALCIVICGSTSAAPVDPNAPDGVAALSKSSSFLYALCTDGFAFSMNVSRMEWVPLYDGLPLPVPVSEITDWFGGYFITVSGDLYGFDGLGNRTWKLVPPLTCNDPVQSQSESMSGVKSMFR